MTRDTGPPEGTVGTDLTTLHVRRAIGGDRPSIEWIVSHFHSLVEAQVRLRLRGRGNAHDVDDLVADVWTVTLQRLGDLQPRGGRYAPVLVRFLGTTALRRCNAFLRECVRRALRAGTADASEGDPGLDRMAAETRGLLTRAAQRDVHEILERCLAELSPDKRDVLVLRLLEQRTNQEIAAFLGIPPNTVAVRYRRALEALRAKLPEDSFDELQSSLRRYH